MTYESNDPCAACGMRKAQMVTYHHLYTRKSRPDLALKDFNLLPVCQAHHNEIHQKGTTHMSAKYSGVMKFLLDNEWMFDGFLNKWRHELANIS